MCYVFQKVSNRLRLIVEKRVLIRTERLYGSLGLEAEHAIKVFED